MQSLLGQAMGSHAWTSSGEQDKAHGVSVMKAAAESRDPTTQGYGRAEEIAGRVVGCEGMKTEGEASKKDRVE